MALVFLTVFCLAVLHPFSASRTIVASMTARQHGSTGSIVSADGDVLFDGANLCYADIRTLTGSLDNIADNTLIEAYLPELTGADQYSPLAGLSSMENAKSDLHLTLRHDTTQTVDRLFGGKSGAAVAFNYETGEIYVLYSAPYLELDQWLTTEQENSGLYDGIYLNKCLDGIYIPGSTMKVVAAICAAAQMGADRLYAAEYVCTGTHISTDGASVICIGGTAHGSVGIADALGKSCNGYFADLSAGFNIAAAQQTLTSLGIAPDGKAVSASLDRLTRAGSSTVFNSAGAASTFGMFGQGSSQVNLIDMARIAAAAVNGGSIKEPYLVSSIVRRNSGSTVYAADPGTAVLIAPETAALAGEIWHTSTQTHYSTVTYGTLADCLKTGTAEQTDGSDNKLLLGVSEELHVAFCIVVENYRPGDPTPADIANGMLKDLAARDL